MASEERLLRVVHGHFSRQGVRPTMEDEVLLCDRFEVLQGDSGDAEVPSSTAASSLQECAGPFAVYAVFDGHGGSAAATFGRNHLRDKLAHHLSQPSAQVCGDAHMDSSLTWSF